MAVPTLEEVIAEAPDEHIVVGASEEPVVARRCRTGKVLRTVSGDAPPQHVSFRRGRAYVTSGDSGTLRVHRTTGQALATTGVPQGSYNVSQGHGWVVTPGLGGGSLCILDAAGRLLRRKQVARSSHDPCVVVTRWSD